MDMKRPLMPGFLKKAEQKLLINKPGLWSTRIHLVLYYGILFMVALALISFLDPRDIRRRTMAEVWIGYTSIISIIALVVWLIYLLRFNVFKKYGIIHPLYSLVTYVLIFIATVTIILFTHVQMAVESARANSAFDGEEIVQDINAMNLKLCQLENARLQGAWDKDTVIVVPDSIYEVRSQGTSYVEVMDSTAAVVVSTHELLSQSILKLRQQEGDSIIRINDSMYMFYDTPPYMFVSVYNADKYTAANTLSAMEIYHQAVKPSPPANKETIAKELRGLLNKYIIPEDTLYETEPLIYKDDSEFEVIRKKYRLSWVNNNVENVTDKKYRFEPDHLPLFARVVYYIALSVSLLIFVFRRSTIKTFFLSLLTAVLLTIFTTLFLAYSGFEETSMFMSLMVYTILFFFGSLANWIARKRNVLIGIATNLFVLLVPIFPLLCATWYYQMKRRMSYTDPDAPAYEVSNTYWLIAEWSGIVLFLILLATYIHRVYRRWYSLPEE